jgi:hypothetical protein
LDEAKVRFLSAAWIDAARTFLEDLVWRNGEPGRSFSLCERFTGAPDDIAPQGVASWHFRIVGKSVEVGSGEIGDCDVVITSDYDTALPDARRFYPQDASAQTAAKASRSGLEGDLTRAPPYLVELHNLLAEITA